MVGLPREALSEQARRKAGENEERYNAKNSQYQQLIKLKGNNNLPNVVDRQEPIQMQPYPTLLSPKRSIVPERI